MSDPLEPVPSWAYEDQPEEEISQTGFQRTYKIPLADINCLKQNLLKAQSAIASATSIIQKCELDPWYWDGAQDSQSQNHGHQPPDQQKVSFMEKDIVSVRDGVNQANNALQTAGALVQKSGFGPNQNKGFHLNN